MKRIDLWKAKLKIAKAERRIRERDANAATRALMRVRANIQQLETKIERHLAQP
jgi:hypothetical protein